MIPTPVLSQRDTRWAKEKLGHSDLTIGSYGCTLTCITMLAGLTDVLDTNNRMKKYGGFSGPLIYWSQVPQALKNLTFIGRYKIYNNDVVRDWVYNKKTPVIVEVDAGPIGSPQMSHFVLYIGDGKLVDPWAGKIRPTSDFPKPKGYALYQYSDPVRTILYGSLSDSDKVRELKKIFPK